MDKKTHLALALAAFVSLSAVAAAAPGSPAEAKTAEKRDWRLVAKLSKVLPEAAATQLDQMLLASSPAAAVGAAATFIASLTGECPKLSDGTICPNQWLIHVLDLERVDDLGNERHQVKKSRVFLYRNGVSFEELKGTRIFGESRIGTLFLGRNVELTSPISILGQEEVDPSDRIPKDVLQIGQFVAAKRKPPAWWTNLLDLGKLASLTKAVPPAEVPGPRTVYGVGLLEKLPVPGDVWIQAGRVTTEMLSNVAPDAKRSVLEPEWIETFDTLSPEVKIANEKRYHFDFSIGLPVTKIDELQYSTTDSTVITRNTGAESVLGLFNLVLWKHGIDLDNPKSYPYPRLLLGLGLKGRVLERPFVGFGIGLGWGPLSKVPVLRDVQPYAGLQRTISAVDADAAAAGIRPSAAWKLAFGINVPVKSIVDRKAKKE